MKRFGTSSLCLLLAGALSGCFAGGEDSGPDQQLLRGHIPLDRYASPVIGVRVVANGHAVASAQTDENGNFKVLVPVGTHYAFEVVTRSGSYATLVGPLDRPTPMTFDVCDPGADFDLGDISPFDFEEIDGDPHPWTDTEDDCETPPWICEDSPDGQSDCYDTPLPCQDESSDPEFCWSDPLPCDDPQADPDFCTTEPWICDDPMDPDCGQWPPPPCDPMSDPNSDCPPPPPPPPCDPDDPTCGWGCNSMDPSDCPPPPPCDPDDPTCGWDSGPGCSDSSDPSVPGCDEPWNGDCMSDYDDPACWPKPEPCLMPPDGSYCSASGGAAPQFPFPDFGCGLE